MKWIFVFFFLVAIHSAFADEAALQFEQANELYRAGDFPKAAAMYEQIVKNGYVSPELYFNLGNAFFKLKNIPGAILNYERAKKLAPHDDDILYNLRLANLRVVDKIEPVPTLFLIDWWRAFINLYTADGWALGAIASLWVVMILGMAVLTVRSFFFRRIVFFLGFLSFVVAIFCFVGTFQRQRLELSESYAVVFNPSTPVKSAPDLQSIDLFVIHEGVKVELLDSVGEWRKIRLADGKIGWINGESVHAI